jgi:hypothetical protein
VVKLRLLFYGQRAHYPVLDGDDLAASTSNAASGFNNRLVVVRTSDEAAALSPSSGIIDRIHLLLRQWTWPLPLVRHMFNNFGLGLSRRVCVDTYLMRSFEEIPNGATAITVNAEDSQRIRALKTYKEKLKRMLHGREG